MILLYRKQYGNGVASFVRELKKQKNRMVNGYSFRPSPDYRKVKFLTIDFTGFRPKPLVTQVGVLNFQRCN